MNRILACLGLTALTLGVVFAWATPARAVQKCVAPDGSVTYTNQGCAGAAREDVQIHDNKGLGGLRPGENLVLQRLEGERQRHLNARKRSVNPHAPRVTGRAVPKAHVPPKETCFASKKNFHQAMNNAYQRGELKGSRGRCVRYK